MFKMSSNVYCFAINECLVNLGQKKPQQEGGNCCGTKTQDMGRVLAKTDLEVLH